MKGIRIVAKKDGFRRAGMAHHGTQTYAIDHFSKAQLDALMSEPMLVVDEIDIPEQETPKDKTAKKPADRPPTQ